MARTPQARAAAAQALTRLLAYRQILTEVLPGQLAGLSNPQDQALVQEICYGVMRWYHRLLHVYRQLVEKELKSRDTDIRMLILVGLYQLMYLRTPPHAAVSATVEACEDLHKPWAKKLVNALLRRYLRESDGLLKSVNEDPESRYSHPLWLLQCLEQELPAHWAAITAANNSHPPMTLRVNRKKMTRDLYLQSLHKAGIEARPASGAPVGIVLAKAMDVAALPGFMAGEVSIQDAAAQLTPDLFDLAAGQRILDACAAPGGKLAHILEYCPDPGTVVALEPDKSRFARMQATLQRLGLTAELVLADAHKTSVWWDGKLFDRILLDAPCSGTGVIRRHPDIKVLRKPEDVAAATALQAGLLAALWPLLATGGKLLYVTCSILDCENDQQIENFMNMQTDARLVPLKADTGTATRSGLRILPGEYDMDGFYYACLEKK